MNMLVGVAVNVALVRMLAPYARFGGGSASEGLLGRVRHAYDALPAFLKLKGQDTDFLFNKGQGHTFSRCTGGMTSTDQENQSTPIGCILDMSGTNTTRLIMTTTTHHLKLSRATSSIYFTLILWINQKRQRTLHRKTEAVGRHAL